jgi:hypothetical protein
MFGPKVKASYREFLPPQLRPDVNKEEDFENFFPSARKLPDVTSSTSITNTTMYFSLERTFEAQKRGFNFTNVL